MRMYNQRVCARARACAVAVAGVDPGLLEPRHGVGATGGGAHRAVQFAEVLQPQGSMHGCAQKQAAGTSGQHTQLRTEAGCRNFRAAYTVAHRSRLQEHQGVHVTGGLQCSLVSTVVQHAA